MTAKRPPLTRHMTPSIDLSEPRGSVTRARQPSIGDVAALAGVSHQTVSRVLNQHPNVRDMTRARVLAAIDRLGYRPNSAARALASGRSKTLGVVALNTGFYGPASTLLSIQEAAQHHGYFVSAVAVSTLDRQSVREAVRRLTSQAVEGLVIITPYTSAHEALAELPTGTPVVAVEGDPEGQTSVVMVDQFLGAKLATGHLLELGHETVFHVAGPGEWLEARGRTEGWQTALEAAGKSACPPITGDWTARSGYDAGQLLAQVPEARAIFVANDQMALGVLRALHERGREVPGDVAVVGFDDIPESGYFVPPLTTVRQDFRAVGQATVDLLVDQLLTGEMRQERVVIAPELIGRASTRLAPPATPV